jgi:hypothetical protein
MTDQPSNAGHTEEAIILGERVAADAVRILGPNHPDARSARFVLAVIYRKAWRIGDMITVLARIVIAATRARRDKLRVPIRARKPRG